MGRSPFCEKQLGVKKGPWTPDEDKLLVDYIQVHGHGSWRSLPKLAGLQRCGKSCRLRWTNYLRPDIKRGPFTPDEQKSIIQLHGIVGNKWSTIAAQLPGRTDNEIKNYWNTHLKKRLLRMGINPETYSPPHASPLSLSSAAGAGAAAAANATSASSSSFYAARHMAQWESARLEAEARLTRQSLIFTTSSSVAAANAVSASTVNQTATAANPQPVKKEPVDVFLRMWNSGIGESFRKQGKAERVKDNEEEELSRASSSCNTKQSSALTVSGANAAETEAAGAAGRREEAESRSLNEEMTSDETYQFYLDLAAGDDLSLFQSHHQMGSCYSLLGSELNEVSQIGRAHV